MQKYKFCIRKNRNSLHEWYVVVPRPLWGKIGNTKWVSTWEEAIRFVNDQIGKAR